MPLPAPGPRILPCPRDFKSNVLAEEKSLACPTVPFSAERDGGACQVRVRFLRRTVGPATSPEERAWGTEEPAGTLRSRMA